jgi:hypothetical protein
MRVITIEIVNTRSDEIIKLVLTRSLKAANKFVEQFNEPDSFARIQLSESFNKALCKQMTDDLNDRLRKVGVALTDSKKIGIK